VNAAITDTVVDFPALQLRPYIGRYAGFRVSGMPRAVHFGLPSSEVNLIISLDRSIDLIQMPGCAQRPAAFTALVSGLQNAPAVVRQCEDAFGLHVFIKPLGVRAILGIASPEISSLVVNLSDIWGSRAEDLVEVLRAADTWKQRFAILDRTFVSRLNPIKPQSEISWAWSRLLGTHGVIPIQKLADEIGYSRRYFSESFRTETGISPKAAARVFRFQRACRLIADRRSSLAYVAAACGYFDQAHLTREWHALAGCSPKAWIARDLPFLQDYEIGDCENRFHDLASIHKPLA
jgi:AraC-like DNA-binding protein